MSAPGDGDAHLTGAPNMEPALAAGTPVSPPTAQAAALEASLVQPTLFSYVANDLVWARASAKATDPFWPGRMIDVNDAPEGVRRECVANAVCVQFYGPSSSKSRERDYCWAKEKQLAPFSENLEILVNQSIPKRLRPSAFTLAVEETQLLFREHGRNVSALYPVVFVEDGVEGVEGGGNDPSDLNQTNDDGTGVNDSLDSTTQLCTSCSLPLEPALLKTNGVKNTGRCRLCSKLHKEKQFCPVCDKVWQWANCPAMVGCDSCDFWVHAACDHKAQMVMDVPDDGPEVMYYCPVCVKKTEKENAKVAEKEAKEAAKEAAKEKVKAQNLEKQRLERAEKAQVKAKADAERKRTEMEHTPEQSVKFEGFDVVPELDFGAGKTQNNISRKVDLKNAPKLITHKKVPGGVPRRPKSAWQIFGSDFFKQYREAHKDDEGGVNFSEVYKFQGQAWRDLPDDEKVVYEAQAKVEAEKFRNMIASLNAQGMMPAGREGKGGGGRSGKSGAGGSTFPGHASTPNQLDMGGGVTRTQDGVLLGPDGKVLSKTEQKAFESGYQPRVDRRASHWSQHFKADEILKRPDKVGVMCNGVSADFHIKEFRMNCLCSQCKGNGKKMSATEFEKHAGMGQAKKWKASIRMVQPARMPIGRWLDGGMKSGKELDKDGKKGYGKASGKSHLHGSHTLHKKNLGYKLVRVKWSVDRCAVCDDDRDFDFDQLVTCEGCAISVHQSCYGIPEIPDDAVGYLCAACEHTGGVVSETPLCVLCPVEGGALKPTTEKNKWCHSACCQWIPETTVLDIDTMEPVDQIKTIQRERWELLCTVCKQRMGAKIQCASPGCYLAYHPLCARAAGLFMEQSLDDENNLEDDSPLVMVSYCHRHCRVDTERAQEWVGDGELTGPGNRLKGSKDLIDLDSKPAKKLTKAEQEKADLDAAEKAVKDLIAKRLRDDQLDQPEDEFGAARCRPYDASKHNGHPRTEAGDEVIVADKTIRRALQHGLGGLGRDGGNNKKRREREAWVQCETCAKWRRVRQSVAEAYGREDAGQWTCSVSDHPRVNECSDPQELPDDDIDERVALGDKCPFYDDDDLDPPETEVADEDGDGDGDDSDVSDVSDDDSDALLQDAPPGGWNTSGAFGDDDQVLPMEHNKPGVDVGVVVSPDAKHSRDDAEPDDGCAEDETISEDSTEDTKKRARDDEDGILDDAKRRRDGSGSVEIEDAAMADVTEDEVPTNEPPVAEAETNAGVEEEEEAAVAEETNNDETTEPSPPKEEPKYTTPDPPKAPLSTLPPVKVLCKYIAGVFRPADNMIACSCARCEKLGTLWEPNRWEVHCGMRQAKKWKTSIRVVDPVDQPSDEEREQFKLNAIKRKHDAMKDGDDADGYDSGDNPSEIPSEVEVFLGEWMDRNGIVLEVVPATRRVSQKKKDDDPSKPKPEKKPQAGRRKRSGKSALAGLAIDLDLDLGTTTLDIEQKASNLIGRHLMINPNAGPDGAQLILGGAPNKPPKWLDGVVTDMKMSRGGCRHFVKFVEQGDATGDATATGYTGSDWFTLNRVEIKWAEEEGTAPDLSFLPSTAPIQSTRRGMGGMSAMFAKSKADPAPLGKFTLSAKKRNDDLDDDEDEDENVERLVLEKALVEQAKAVGGEGSGDVATDVTIPNPDANLDNPTPPPNDSGLIGVLPDDLPDVVTVVCKQTAGDYYPRTGLIKCLCDKCLEEEGEEEEVKETKEKNENGTEDKDKDSSSKPDDQTKESATRMDPNRWEMHCGMGQAKKWKASVRVVLANHRTMPVGKWLTGFGVAVSAQRAPRREVRYGPKRSKLNKMKKKGLYDSEDELYRRLEPMGKGGKAAVKKGPPVRTGKRTFIELIPYVVRGAKLRSKGGNNKGGFASVGFSGVDGVDGQFESGDPSNLPVKPTTFDPAVAEGASLDITSTVFTPEQWEGDRSRRLATRTTGNIAQAAMEAAAKMIDEGKGVRERILDSQRLLKDRLTFGKSNIHGWGLIAKQPIKAGTMVIPFRGEKLRPSVANLREKKYEETGKDCYLLMADPKTVIDTTCKGNVARFTNHSCNPNMYTKIVSADNQSHIIFFTRTDVNPGEELTYNYRFDAESGKVPCFCGAHNCRGFLC